MPHRAAPPSSSRSTGSATGSTADHAVLGGQPANPDIMLLDRDDVHERGPGAIPIAERRRPGPRRGSCRSAPPRSRAGHRWRSKARPGTRKTSISGIGDGRARESLGCSIPKGWVSRGTARSLKVTERSSSTRGSTHRQPGSRSKRGRRSTSPSIGRKAEMVPGRLGDSQANKPATIRRLICVGIGPRSRIRARRDALSMMGQGKGPIGTISPCGCSSTCPGRSSPWSPG